MRRIAVLGLLFGAVASCGGGGRVFVADGGALLSMNLDGSDVSTLVPGAQPDHYLTGVAVDPEGKFVYWTDNVTEEISRIPSRGGAREVLYRATDAFSNPRGVAVDVKNQRLFWAQGGALLTSRLDGSQVSIAVARAQDAFVTDIQVDPDAQQLYWTDNGNDAIYRADYACILSAAVPMGIALPTTPAACIAQATKLYSNPDPFSNPVGVAIDPKAKRMFWGEHVGIPGNGNVMVAGIDGSSPRVLIAGGADSFPTAVAVDPNERRIYWTDNGKDTVSSATYEGTDVKVLHQDSDPYSNPAGIALSP